MLALRFRAAKMLLIQELLAQFLRGLGVCAAEGVEAKSGPSEDSF